MLREAPGAPLYVFERFSQPLLPLVRKPRAQLADGSGGQVDEQLREIELRVDLMPAAGAREASEDGRSSSAARIAYEE